MKDSMSINRKEKPSMICFHVRHSGAFHLMKPVLKDLMEDYQDRVDFVFLEQGEDLLAEEYYEVKYYPTLLLVCKQCVFEKFEGLISRVELYEQFDHLMDWTKKQESGLNEECENEK